MTADVVRLHPDSDADAASEHTVKALATLGRYLDRCALAANTVTAYRRQAAAKAASSTVNQALAALMLLYEHGHRLKIRVKRARVHKPVPPTRSPRRRRRGPAGRRPPRYP